MTRPTLQETTLVAAFLGLIALPAAYQTATELRQGEPVQALEILHQPITSEDLRAYERGLEQSSEVAKVFRPVMQYAQFRWLGEGGDKALLGRDGWLFYKPGFRYLTQPPPRDPAAPDPLPAIVAFRDGLADRGIRLLVLIIPNKESIYPQKVSRRAAGLEVLIPHQTRELMARLQTAGIETVDLFEGFRAAKRAGGQAGPPLYLKQDSHWSPAGVALAAQAVADRVLGRAWVARGQLEFQTRPAPVRRLGDIVRMLRVPALERHLAPEEVACQQIIRADTQLPYQDDPRAEVLVLGDSFLRIYEQDEPRAAGFLAHLARALRQPVASLVSDGGASTLVRQDLSGRPGLLANKKLVIWEFVERDIRVGTEGWQMVPLPGPVTAQTTATTPPAEAR